MAKRKRSRPGRGRVRRSTAGRRPARRRARRAPARAPRLVRYGASAVAALMMGAIALAGIVAFYARDLPSTAGLWDTGAARRITLVALDGAPIPVHGETRSAPVRLAALPPHVPAAVLAVEDRNFEHHIGVNPLSLVRALIANARAGGVVQGGSTITQQLAKNVFLTPDRTLKRKIQELLLALWLEQQFTKDEILTIYLNRVYFGAGAYGVDAAAFRYFGKSARDITVGEAAVLAGLLKAPSKYSPTSNPADAGARARLVIDAMEEAGFLRPLAAERARAEPVRLMPSRLAVAPHFVDYISAEVAERAQGADADLLVRTTFDRRIQKAVDDGVAAALSTSPLPDGADLAVVVIDAEGAVRGMAGGRNYEKSQFNRASQARRQPGSTFKPFVYLAALEAGFTPDDEVLDAPVTVDRWTPDNYNSRYYGEVTLRDALALSLNSAVVRVQEQVGRSAVRISARRMGLPLEGRSGPALALGVEAVTPLELAGAYAPLANGGFAVSLHSIEAIRTSDGQRVWMRDRALGEPAARFASIANLNDMLRAAVDTGTGKLASIPGRDVAGKTGTSQDSRDAWFAGHAGGLVAVVWVGRDDNAPMRDITGGAAPAVIFREVMTRALDGTRPAPMVAPVVDPVLAPVRPNADAPTDDPLAQIIENRT